MMMRLQPTLISKSPAFSQILPSMEKQEQIKLILLIKLPWQWIWGLATKESYPNADYFVAYVHEGKFYWLNQKLEWTTAASSAYQGALIDFRSFKIPSPSVNLPSGTSIPIYFGSRRDPKWCF